MTTGASDDLDKIESLAHRIVTKFGMDSKLRPIFYQEDNYGNKMYSQKTSERIDAEKRKLIDECEEKTRELVTKYQDKITE